MFTAPPLCVIKDESQITEQSIDVVHYFYQVNTFNQLSRKIEISTINQSANDINIKETNTQ
jgi:hypothetical protein